MMKKPVITNDAQWVKMSDYLKVVEEKENVEKNLHRVQEHLQIKVEKIEKLKIKMDTVTTFRNAYYNEVEQLKRENEELGVQLKEMTNHKDNTFLRVLELEKENEEFMKTVWELTGYLHEAEEDKQKCFDIITGISLEYKKLKNHNDALVYLLEDFNVDVEPVEDTYTLIYGYESDGKIKEYKQSGLLKDEYEEMYGMDSDNWLYHTLVKDEK